MAERKKNLDYKIGYYSHRFFEAQMPLFKIASAVFGIVFATLLISKYTPYYYDVREFVGFDTNQWFLKTLIGFGLYSGIMMFVGTSAFFHELDGGDIDE